jgi:hypothetical protein
VRTSARRRSRARLNSRVARESRFLTGHPPPFLPGPLVPVVGYTDGVGDLLAYRGGPRAGRRFHCAGEVTNVCGRAYNAS